MLGEMARTSCWIALDIAPSGNCTSNFAGPSGKLGGICALICQGVTARIAAGCALTNIARPFRELGTGVVEADMRVSPARLAPNALIKPPTSGYNELWLIASSIPTSTRGA